jgi:hypothetical protein
MMEEMRHEPFLIPENLADIDNLIRTQVQENIHLDYKDSRAIRKDGRDEMAKDVSAFANADGGVLIYGVPEKDHLPIGRDTGVDDSECSREWIESAVMTRITPRAEVRITPIPVSPGRSLYVVEVPKTLRGPHQAADRRYYKRHNFKSDPMEHYEIADVRNRRNVFPPLVSFRTDIYGRTIVMFDVENIGTIVAQDVRFEFSPSLPWPDGAIPPALDEGIAYLQPRQKLRFRYFQTWEILTGKCPSPIEFTVRVSYTRGGSNVRVTDEFAVNFSMYRGAMVVQSDEQAFNENALEALQELATFWRKNEQLNRSLSIRAVPSFCNSVRIDVPKHF